jgi:hypothetical protein
MKMINLLVAISLTIMLNQQFIFAQEDTNASPFSEQQLEEQVQGQLLLNKIINRTPRFSIVGILEKSSADAYSINGEKIAITSETRIEGELVTGLPVSVHGFIENGQKRARVIRIGSVVSEGRGKKSAFTEGTSALDIEQVK